MKITKIERYNDPVTFQPKLKFEGEFDLESGMDSSLRMTEEKMLFNMGKKFYDDIQSLLVKENYNGQNGYGYQPIVTNKPFNPPRKP